MKSDFLLAITQLSAEKNLPSEVVIAAVEAALVSAYRKDNFVANQDILVKINPTSGKVQVWAEKIVVERPSDSRCEISLDEARLTEPEVQIDETVVVEATPHNAGRIAAQTAKQVILQRLHEAEHSAIFEEYAGREGDIITGVVQRIEPRQILVDLGRTEAILPASGQVHNERYRVGQRLKANILEVVRTGKGPRVVLSRSHPDLVRRLFEMEVPEIFDGAVELKTIAREAGSRSKVAVAARQDGVDPVGCCVGLRGIRIQNIVNELNGEKIDVVMWSPDTPAFIANALSPAQVLSIELNEGEGIATVVVPDRQLSLAIGKEGQNVRLAAKLSGWRIDIKSASVAEAEKAEAAEVEAEEEEAAIAEEIFAEVETVLEPALASVEVAEPLPALDTAFVPPPAPFESPAEKVAKKPQLRFAEDIAVPVPTKPQAKSKKKKKKEPQGRESEEDGTVKKKPRRELEISLDDDEDY
ncbi:transcription termination factor NusA [Chloroflexota bacterium]